ncbi:DUF2510 domain-containing protein [Nocardioides sp. L-11A]|uniref:DUF2510 domain-containing protein n=1 Tax=Nocardioides sp. L-11A TaxID=3043848 RepID=UPI00249A4AC2|nr:DUF2510 domain-containing protein [Nocardioides sp. L-11A]
MRLFGKKRPRQGQAGWYPHPTLTGQERWWDGERWTSRSRVKGEVKAAQRQHEREVDEVARREQEEARKRLICPHCQTAGHVTVGAARKNHGISGGKATGAILTGGASLFATGLARKGWVTRLSCSNCGMSWEVE